MAELVPVPLHVLLRRAYHEFRSRRAIFDLPERKFRRRRTAAPAAALDLSVSHSGTRAGNPVGPAAGPHTQLAQNIALGWLAGARVCELKTIQANDRLALSRPCIDMATIGYNTEFSQELSLEESLREYVKASMMIEVLDAWGVVDGGWDRTSGIPPSREGLSAGLGGPDGTRDTDGFVFDISVGYDLEGIRSAAVVRWLEAMRHAAPIIDGLRAEIPDEFACLRDYPFKTRLASGITLSTFHGTPADEIERIGEFLIGGLGFHTAIKLNPPMLGRARLEAILHGVLGYDDVVVNPEVYERNLPFDEAVDLLRRLQAIAVARKLTVGVKCGNTLEVLNTGSFLKERVQYLSGQALHPLQAALALRWREAAGPDLQISFSAGVDAQNVADCVAAGLVPVTVCTDLLRPGGYGRLPRYLASLEERMLSAGARTIAEFIMRTAGVAAAPIEAGGDVLTRAVLRNARALADAALTSERYRASRNRKPPRKLGTRLWLWDCLSCSKCIPVCPNDAIFELEIEPFIGELPVVRAAGGAWHDVGRKLYRALKPTQIAVFADACNDCGNCDVFCPEDGGPHIEKPRFFGSLESWRRASPLTGFVLSKDDLGIVLRGRMAEGEFALSHLQGSDEGALETREAVVTLNWHTHEVMSVRARESPPPRAGESARAKEQPPMTHSTLRGNDDRDRPAEPRCPPEPSGQPSGRGGSPEAEVLVDLSAYMTLRILLDALLQAQRVNFANAAVVG